jgi:excisionase family DNA binding protein
MEKFLTTAKAAEERGVSQSTIARWCAAGWIRCVKMGKTWLVDTHDLMDFEPPRRGPKKKGEAE